MDHPPDVLRTNLIDLNEVLFAELRDYDESLLKPSTQRLLRRIEKHRTNIGGSGPPGRVD